MAMKWTGPALRRLAQPSVKGEEKQECRCMTGLFCLVGKASIRCGSWSCFTGASPGSPKAIHLLLVDVHRRPLQFSFADQIASELRLDQSACPAPFALAYRVGEPAPGGGRFLAVWRRPLTVGSPLPPLRLPLSMQESVLVDLEATYTLAPAAAYLR